MSRSVDVTIPVSLATLIIVLLVPLTVMADDTIHVVEQGDRLGGLARQYNVTVEQIRDWNELDGDLIRIGQELTIHPDSAPASASSGGWTTYVVQPGDRLGSIARHHDVGVDDIVGWNRGLHPDRISVGQEIRVRGYGRQERRINYEIQRGDFIGRVANRYNVTIADIVEWNDGLDPDRVRIGQEIVLVVAGPEDRSESVGRANEGRLVNGEQLAPHRGFRMRDSDRAWGTNETITFMLEAFDHMRSVHPDAPRVRVHDLSYRRGGSMRGHHSHQSGRDADIGLYQNRCRGGTCPFREVRPSNLDVERQWALLRYWLRHNQVEYIFLDYDLQEPLYEYAQSQGATRAQLNEWFQYPHGSRSARGVIRHEPNHADHIHVRFGCAGDDDRCR